MTRTFGRKPKPRVLVVGVDDDPELAGLLSLLAPTVRFVGVPDLVSYISQPEFDLAVLWNVDAAIDTNLPVVQFGGSGTGTFAVRGFRFEGVTTSHEPSDEFTQPEGQVPQIGPLLPALAESLANQTRSRIMAVEGAPGRSGGIIVPVLLNSFGNAVAGTFRRGDTAANEWWWLPFGTPEPHRWVAAVLARFSEADPARYEADATDWLSNPRWQTAAERAANAAIDALDAAHAAAIDRYRQSRDRAMADRTAVSEAAEEAERRLLTAQGPELVDEVAAALAELGFDPRDADLEHAKPGDKLEDLRVLDPGDPDWIALIEVRGYKRGAQLGDLQRIERFVQRFVLAEQRLPDAKWYVVNQFLEGDPGERPAPLSSNQPEVDTFAEDGGLVIDTRDLFVLRERVRAGGTSQADAKAMLKQIGRLALPQ